MKIASEEQFVEAQCRVREMQQVLIEAKKNVGTPAEYQELSQSLLPGIRTIEEAINEFLESFLI